MDSKRDRWSKCLYTSKDLTWSSELSKSSRPQISSLAQVVSSCVCKGRLVSSRTFKRKRDIGQLNHIENLFYQEDNKKIARDFCKNRVVVH